MFECARQTQVFACHCLATKVLATGWVEVTMRYPGGERGSSANILVTRPFDQASHAPQLKSCNYYMHATMYDQHAQTPVCYCHIPILRVQWLTKQHHTPKQGIIAADTR